MVFLQDFFLKNVDFEEKNQNTTKDFMNNTQDAKSKE